MKRINATGQPCPIPVIEAKKAMAESDAVAVLVDNIVAVQNLEKMARGLGYAFSYTPAEASCFEVMLGHGSASGLAARQSAPAAQSLSAKSGEGLVVVISADSMGRGAEELGKILLKGFVYSLTELETPPACVILLNSGAQLSAEGANTVADLQKLEERGTQIMTCGTCSTYYGIQEQLAVGSIVNMFAIVEKMAAAYSVVTI